MYYGQCGNGECALQHFVGDFNQSALTSLQFFFRGNVCTYPQFRKQEQTTTPGTSCPSFCEKCVGSLTSPVNQHRDDAGDGACGLSSLSEKTRKSNNLQMSLLR